MNNQIYKDIWLNFNQNSLEQISKNFTIKQSELIFSEIEEYFDNNGNYKFIRLDSIKSYDKHFLEEKEISLQYIVKNFKKTIYKNKAKISFDGREFQLQVIEDKFIYAICPFSGEILKSNQSIVVTPSVIFYRFSSRETFYLITTNLGRGFTKGAIYFPNHELIIKCDDKTWGLTKKNLIHLKTLLVSNFQDFNHYFFNNQPKKIAIIIGHPNFAHHIWNELSGIYRIYRQGSLNKVHKFFVMRETLGLINEIFPEILIDNIKYFKTTETVINLNSIPSEMLQEIVSNNYLVINVGDQFITNDLADRVYQVAVKNCSAEIIDKIKAAKKKHFPLLWISIRVDTRTWINQIDGLSQIINSLALNYPQIGVVFDGFSIPADYFTEPRLQPANFGLETIKRQNEIVSQIISNLSNLEIGVFNTVGCSIWETNLWANTIDLYLAHHGTIQHKVGWLANKPGIVHSNEKVLRENHLYVANAREFGIEPIYISHIHVKDIDIKEQKIKSELRNDLNNYEVDWNVLYQEIWKLSQSIVKRKSLIGRLLNFSLQTVSLRKIKKIIKSKLKYVNIWR